MTGLQSSTASRRPTRAPTPEELPPLLERQPLAIFDEAITFMRIQPATMLGTAFIVLLPLRLIAGLMPGSALRDARPDQVLDIFIGNLTQPGAIAAAIGAVAADSIALFTVAAIYGRLLAAWYSGEAPTAADVLVWSIKKSPVIFLLWAFVHLIEGFAAFSTLGVGVFAGVLLIIVAPLIGAEGAGLKTALRRSLDLSSSSFLRCAIIFVLAGVGGQLMRAMLRFVPSILGINLLPLPLWIVSGFFDILATTVSISFTAAVSVILYLDLRIRREGIDLDMAMARTFPGARVRQSEDSSDG